jgi:hypothetical protein
MSARQGEVLLAAFVARHEDEEEYVAWARELGGVTSEEAP